MSTPFEMEQKLQYRLEQSRAHKNIQLVSVRVRMSRLHLSSQNLTFASISLVLLLLTLSGDDQ
jgi:hypothetical protein